MKNLSWKETLGKIKQIKNIEIILAVAIGLVILLIYFLPGENRSEGEKKSSNVSGNIQKQTDEERLKAVLSQMEGVGKTEVMITYESGVELVPAFESSRQETVTTGSSQSSTTVSENNQLVTVYGSGGNQALILVEKNPAIKGVIVIAQGASDLATRMNLYKAVQTVLQIPASKVDIFEMKKKGE